MNRDVAELQATCSQIASCLPKGTEYHKTLFGGFFTLNGRKVYADVDPISKAQTGAESTKIRKIGNGFGMTIHPKDTMRYNAIKESVKRGLGIFK